MDDLNSINKLYNDFIFVHKFFGVPFGETILSQEYINIYIIRFLKDQFRYKRCKNDYNANIGWE